MSYVLYLTHEYCTGRGTGVYKITRIPIQVILSPWRSKYRLLTDSNVEIKE